MTTEIEEEDGSSEGGMSEHLQRYRKYIDSLKEGRSSGISSVFGRASDLLPADVLEIKPPTLVAERLESALMPEQSGENIENQGQFESDNVDHYFVDENQDSSDDSNSYEESDCDDPEDDDSDEDAEEFEGDETEDSEDEADDEFEDDDSFDDESSEGEGTEQLTVKSAQGSVLWTIYFNRVEPLTITMADGSSVKNAEGRDDTILALKTNDQLKFFILSGLVIDPITGNIYVEANDGAFTAAFLNNGWQIQQYRNHEGEETYYATEPYKPGRDRLTMQITNVALDPVNGEVSYDSLDGSASMTLKSRKLLKSAAT